MQELYDVIIIGGGPAGLSAAQYASRSKLRTVVLDKSPAAGALAYSGKIENYPGLSQPVTGKQLLDTFRNQAIQFGAEYIETKVIGVKLEGEVKEVYALDNTYFGKAIIIATGAMGRSATIKGEKEFLGKGVSYCALCDAAFFKGQVVCVIGDNKEALKEAEVLTRFASKVYLISPSRTPGRFDGHPVLGSQNVTVMRGYQTVSIDGEAFVERLKIRNVDSGEEQEIRTAGVFIYLHGNKPIVDFLNTSMKVGEDCCINTNKMMETSTPGVYAAGDVSCVEVRQVIIAAANGCIAALSAEKFVRGRKRRKLDWAKTSED